MTRWILTFGFMPLVFGVALAFSQDAGALNPNHECSFCHNLHGSAGGPLLVEAFNEAVCLSCHGPAGASVLEAAIHSPAGGDGPFSCTDCHDPHDNQENWKDPGDSTRTNLKMVLPQITTPNTGLMDVLFESRGTGSGSDVSLHSFADDNEDDDDAATSSPTSGWTGNVYDGVCEVCHTTTAHHRNTGDPFDAGHQNAGKTCVDCHPHDGGFMPTGGDCTTCHNTVRDNTDGFPTWQSGRRAIVPEFSRASHHVSVAITAADCEVCHFQGPNHQTGNVRLKNADTGAEMVILANDANPLTDATEAAKLTAFCLACHDADGANGAAPFSDGVFPPPYIDSPWWAAGSHNSLGNISCFGDGSTTGCHGSGHGSLKKKILAPADAGPGTDNVDEEEGLCFSCHDGSPAVDIQTFFAATPRHRINDGEQTADGRDAECTLCHNQHYASPTPAHTDGNLASGLIADAWGYDPTLLPANRIVDPIVKEYQLCFRCHSDYDSGTYPPPVIEDGGPGAADPVMNKATQFSTANATFHPVLGSQNNSFCDATTMVAPWNQSGEHDTMWCTDCHRDATVSGPHGGSDMTDNGFGLPVRPSILRAQLSAIEMDNTGAPDPGSDDWVTPLCVQCHSVDTYRFTSSGSNFSAHDNRNHAQPDWTGGYGGCLSCHFGGLSSPDGNITGAIHGGANDHNDNGGTIEPGFLNGSRIVNVGSGSCNPINDRNNGCRGHNQSY